MRRLTNFIFYFNVVSITFITLLLFALIIVDRIEVEDKLDRLYDNQIILQQRLEELERGSK